ncbi:MAG: DUF4159 domain-containing protein [Gemmatimonadaceae bacterium]
MRTRGIALLLLLTAAGIATAQGFRSRERREAPAANVPYDGRFTFARIRFTADGSGGGEGFFRQDLKWDHDYPRAERNFMKILSEVSLLRPYMDGGNILALDDPELFKYPVAYLCEPGFWSVNEKEAQGLRDYLAKGGFIIFDDFIGDHWFNFESQIRKVLPDAQIVPLDVSHPIFDSFFRIESLDMLDPNRGTPARFYGIYEDNDPSKRLVSVINYNNDIGDYWEWSDAGFLPIELSNEAYKLGVNYVIYGMTR